LQNIRNLQLKVALPYPIETPATIARGRRFPDGVQKFGMVFRFSAVALSQTL
jgi:hypothetical protein